MAEDVWEAGTTYEAYMGRWSRPVAHAFLRLLDVPAGARWLDVGCGTGALTAAVLELRDPGAVTGVDPSEGFLATARVQTDDRRVSFRVGDAQSLPLPDGDVDAVVSGLTLNFVPDPRRAVREQARVATPGGVVAAYVWDYAEGMAMLRYVWDAVVALDPAAADLDEGRRFPVCQPAALRALWETGGLSEVVVEAVEVPTVFAGLDDYWTPFLGGQGPAPGYVKSLPDERRRALKALLRDRLPVAGDGSIALTARAWAVRGTVSLHG